MNHPVVIHSMQMTCFEALLNMLKTVRFGGAKEDDHGVAAGEERTEAQLLVVLNPSPFDDEQQEGDYKNEIRQQFAGNLILI